MAKTPEKLAQEYKKFHQELLRKIHGYENRFQHLKASSSMGTAHLDRLSALEKDISDDVKTLKKQTDEIQKAINKKKKDVQLTLSKEEINAAQRLMRLPALLATVQQQAYHDRLTYLECIRHDYFHGDKNSVKTRFKSKLNGQKTLPDNEQDPQLCFYQKHIHPTDSRANQNADTELPRQAYETFLRNDKNFSQKFDNLQTIFPDGRISKGDSSDNQLPEKLTQKQKTFLQQLERAKLYYEPQEKTAQNIASDFQRSTGESHTLNGRYTAILNSSGLSGEKYDANLKTVPSPQERGGTTTSPSQPQQQQQPRGQRPPQSEPTGQPESSPRTTIDPVHSMPPQKAQQLLHTTLVKTFGQLNVQTAAETNAFHVKSRDKRNQVTAEFDVKPDPNQTTYPGRYHVTPTSGNTLNVAASVLTVVTQPNSGFVINWNITDPACQHALVHVLCHIQTQKDGKKTVAAALKKIKNLPDEVKTQILSAGTVPPGRKRTEQTGTPPPMSGSNPGADSTTTGDIMKIMTSTSDPTPQDQFPLISPKQILPPLQPTSEDLKSVTDENPNNSSNTTTMNTSR